MISYRGHCGHLCCSALLEKCDPCFSLSLELIWWHKLAGWSSGSLSRGGIRSGCPRGTLTSSGDTCALRAAVRVHASIYPQRLLGNGVDINLCRTAGKKKSVHIKAGGTCFLTVTGGKIHLWLFCEYECTHSPQKVKERTCTCNRSKRFYCI